MSRARSFDQRALAISRMLNKSVAAVSFTLLSIWLLVPQWKSFSAETMKANTALALLLAAISLELLCAREKPGFASRSAAGKALAFLSLAIGLSTIGEYIFGWNLGIDELLVRDFPNQESILHPGRMSPNAATCFIFLALATSCVYFDKNRRWLNPSIFNIPLLFLTLFTFIGYVFGASYFYSYGPYIRIAWQTAICFFGLSFSLVLMQPKQGLGKILFSGTSGGLMARRLLPAAVLVPICLGYASSLAIESGVDFHLGTAALIVAIIAVLCTVVFLSAHRLNAVDKTRTDAALKYAEQSRLADSFKRSQEFLDAVIENIPNMIFIKDAKDLKFVKLNRAGEELLGISRDQLVGKSDYDFFSREQADFFTSKDRMVLSSDLVLDIPEEEINTARGVRLLHTKKLRLLGPDGESKFLIGISEDITKQKEVETELIVAREKAVQATAAKTSFLANMSHEIRTPINGIIGMTKLLSESKLDGEQFRLATSIEKSSAHLLNLVNDILDLTKVEAGKLELETLTFDLTGLLKDTYESFEPLCRVRGFFFEIRLDVGSETHFLGDPGRIQQVLNNLIGNALKFTKHGGITLLVSREAGYGKTVSLGFSVVDTGVGISSEIAEKLFRSFTQGDISTSRRFGGTGLGLAISKHLTELMGGTISVRSSLGQGSTFHFTVRLLPASPESLSASRQEIERAPLETLTLEQRKGARILVAEDNMINQEITLRMLKRAGYRADAVASGIEVLASVKHIQYDLVLMDCQMPEMDGYEATRALRAEGNSVPVLALTANAFKEDKDKCIAAGMSDYVTKPVQYESLIALVDMWIASPVQGLNTRAAIEQSPTPLSPPNHP